MKKTLVTASIVLAFAAGVFATTAIEKQKESKEAPKN